MHQVAMGSGASHPFIIPLTKIDVARRLVIGTAAEEVEDKSREIMDYATARPQFEAWSKSFSDATGGLSKGNLRVMHTKTVAGRLDQIAYDDETRKVQIVAKVVDDNEWEKCLSGSYTGFSIGGGYLKKWQDPGTGLTRYTPIVREISLVDNPCMPTATFAELVKADGMVTQLQLHGVVHSFADQWAERPVAFSEAWAARPRTFGELLKAEWSEEKHKRGKGGEFAMESAEPDTDKAAEGTMGGFAAGYAMGGIRHPREQIARAAANAKVSVERKVKFGIGEKGLRNETASLLRGAPDIRVVLKSRAHFARMKALIGHEAPGNELAEAGRRKILEEAFTRGSSMQEARISGESFAQKIRARSGGAATVGEVYRDGLPTRRVSPKAADTATRHAKQAMRAGVNKVKASVGEARRAGVGSKFPPLSLGRSLGRRFAFALPMAVVGHVLGQQSATRDKMELSQQPVSTVRDVAATTGDVLRSLGGAPRAAALGAYAGILGSMAGQSLLSRAGGKPMSPMRALDHGVISSRVGQALAIGSGLGTLYHEMSARYGSSPDKEA